MVRGRGEVEAPSAVAGPGLAGQGRVEGDDKLAGRVDGVGGKVKGHTVDVWGSISIILQHSSTLSYIF